MSTFSWLLISDLHLKSNQTTWSQNVVLRDMVRDIERRKRDGTNISFVIVSGDLAHGGKPEQYRLVEKFLDDLIGVLGLLRSDVFIVPGNHDIDRDVCELTFHGTRSEFVNAENVERYLENANERKVLLQRLSAYFEFQQVYSASLIRKQTDDGLAYFSEKLIGSIPIGVAALNSAIACGNDSDERNIVLGDRPMIDLCEVIRSSDVRLVIGVLHHPPFWLRAFDQRTFDERFLPMCDIVHRGHLHEPEVKLLYTSSSTRCLAIAAGAGYVWRQFANSYSIVSFDAAGAECTASYLEYDSHSGTFKAKATEKQSLRLRGEIPGGPHELCAAMSRLGGSAKKFAPYLAALILERVTEVPIPIDNRVVIAASNIVASAQDETYVTVLKDFLNVRNSLLAFASTARLEERVAACESAIREFSDQIEAFTSKDVAFAEDITRRVELASEFCSLPLAPSESTFVATMRQFAAEGDWDGLELIARRYITNESPDVKHSAEQHICLALANSDDLTKKEESLRIADGLVLRADATVDDFRICFSINRNRGHNDRADTIIRDAMARFQVLPPAFAEAATRFAVETGNADTKALLSSGHGVNNDY